MTSKQLKASLRYYFSVEALVSAYANANLSLKIISDKDNLENSEVDIKYSSSVLSAVITSVIFMETTINEFFLDATQAKDDSLLNIKLLGEKFITQMQNFFKIDNSILERESILKKYNLALFILEKENFNSGQEPYQSAKLLIEFRNHLTHYKIQSIDIIKKNSSLLEQKLKGKFDPHPLSNLPDQSIYYPFPRNYLSHNCAKWAIQSSRKIEVKSKPLSSTGGRSGKAICRSLFISAPATPTAKNSILRCASISLILCVAFSQLPVGAPSVIKNTQGR